MVKTGMEGTFGIFFKFIENAEGNIEYSIEID